ncbi:MAG: hypothetical protein SPF92_03950 [Clostridia bacterium]|nr:hypothetical protein [Oscillospiraceae bacterium]MDY5626743.1 hypothetical protein [Clostridia bacterium]
MIDCCNPCEVKPHCPPDPCCKNTCGIFSGTNIWIIIGAIVIIWLLFSNDDCCC